jgi:hypothetical protein
LTFGFRVVLFVVGNTSVASEHEIKVITVANNLKR